MDALAKVVKPADVDGNAGTLKSLIDTYSLTGYDVVPMGILLKSGSSGMKETALQHLLKAAGYSVAITGSFDSATVSAVRKLQKAKKLEVDGEAGRYTLTALFTKLGNGGTGPQTSALHALLAAAGYATSPGDGFGSATLAAVKSFQATAGRIPSGTVDNPTWAALFMTLDTAQPRISGTAEVGRTLQATSDAWGPGSVRLSYQWFRGSSPIGGASADRYDVQIADAGTPLKVVMTGLKAGYTVTSRASAPLSVQNARLTATPTPKITGTLRVDQTVTAIPGTWAPGAVSLAYQWYRDGAAITGATAALYTAHPDDGGAKLTVSVTGARAGFTTVSKTSAATSAVATASLTTIMTPKIRGTRKAGKTLTAFHSAWGPGPVTYSYQWFRRSTPISGATGNTYRARSADRKRSIYVTVTGSRDGYRTVAKKSAAAKINP